jgi:hypothetical protein
MAQPMKLEESLKYLSIHFKPQVRKMGGKFIKGLLALGGTKPNAARTPQERVDEAKSLWWANLHYRDLRFIKSLGQLDIARNADRSFNFLISGAWV